MHVAELLEAYDSQLRADAEVGRALGVHRGTGFHVVGNGQRILEPALAQEVEAEAREAVARLSSRPGLALWCGGSECLWGYEDWDWQEPLAGRSWGQGYYTGLLPSVVAELDPTRPYIPGSPYSPGGAGHLNDPAHGPMHIWDVWNERDYTGYLDDEPRFVSEFGFQGPPTWATLTRALDADSLAPDCPDVDRPGRGQGTCLCRGGPTDPQRSGEHRAPTPMRARSAAQPQLTVHFTGDSVTDCGRRTPEGVPLGDGYVGLLAQRAELAAASVHNTGIGGDRVRELSARWHQDVLSTRPDVLSVLVGINDTWRGYDSDGPTSTDEFHERYEWLLSSARESGVRHIVLCEPFLLPIDAGQRQWRTDLDPKIDAVHDLARRFHAILVATDRELTALARRLGTEALAPDGVHPSAVGHEAIARIWWTAAGALI